MHVMKRRLRRPLGTLFAVAVLAGCAAPPSQTGANASGTLHRTTGAPLAYGEAAPTPPTPTPAQDSKLADAAPIDPSIPDVSGFQQVGRASWYGRLFHGRRTANGERFNMNALTAAHRTLPLASYVRVTNTVNQKSVVVRINDRGPYVRGRVIDLSYAAARVLGLQHQGTGRVKIVGLTQQEAAEAQREIVASANGSNDTQ
jgi:rare lipoprotein A